MKSQGAMVGQRKGGVKVKLTLKEGNSCIIRKKVKEGDNE